MSNNSVDKQFLAHLEVLPLLERVLQLLDEGDEVELRHLELVLHGLEDQRDCRLDGLDDLHDEGVYDLLQPPPAAAAGAEGTGDPLSPG